MKVQAKATPSRATAAIKPVCTTKPPLALFGLVVLEVEEEGETPVLVTTRVPEALVVVVDEDRPEVEDVDPIVN